MDTTQLRVGTNLLLEYVPELLKLIENELEEEKAEKLNKKDKGKDAKESSQKKETEKEKENAKKAKDAKMKFLKPLKPALCEVLVNGLWPEPFAHIIQKQKGLWKREFHDKRYDAIEGKQWHFELFNCWAVTKIKKT